MRIACPSCASEYEVPASRLRPGRMARCAGCGSEWFPVHEDEEVAPPDGLGPPPEAVAAEPVAVLPDVTAMDRLAAYIATPASRPGLTAAWLATFVGLAAAVGVTVEWHHAIVRAWPPSGRIFGVNTPTQPPPIHTEAKNPQ